MRQIGSFLSRRLPAVQIYGANTGVGKTVVSTALCRALRRLLDEKEAVHYLKPVSTGPHGDQRHLERFAPGVQSRLLYSWPRPVSPHVAARAEGSLYTAEGTRRVLEPPTDRELLEKVWDELISAAESQPGAALVETAGCVLSPTPSASLQADLYRPLRLPVVLVGDPHLGGIGSTLQAAESLELRGYDIEAVVLLDHPDAGGNPAFLKDQFTSGRCGRREFEVLSLPFPPKESPERRVDEERMQEYYEGVDASRSFDGLVDQIRGSHQKRIEDLGHLASRTDTCIWHPFTQHQIRSKDDILVIDSAHGDFFQAYTGPRRDPEAPLPSAPSPQRRDDASSLTPAFDGSASWWTQGFGHGNPTLALVAGYAAGRYGHVMFGGATHEPAQRLAAHLTSLGNGRLRKVFFSDNGSTGTEVAMKMALRAASVRYKWGDISSKDVIILGMKGSYHGDTIGAMDASEPSIYNTKEFWYRGRGYWFDFPTVKMRRRTWIVEPPSGMEKAFGPIQTFASLQEIFDSRTRADALERYKGHIVQVVQELTRTQGKKLGALMLEPIVLGAGGMLFADPLFQYALVDVVRSNPALFGDAEVPGDPQAWTGLPVIFDEVFTGLYRLGVPSPSELVGAEPDIVVNAKLLTGGLLPLCTTAASESVFEAFLGSTKADALLHGHSYTAHPIGCTVADYSIRRMQSYAAGTQWKAFVSQWQSRSTAHESLSDEGQRPHRDGSKRIWSMWRPAFLESISGSSTVESVWALGTVLAISLHDEGGGGYTSTAADALQRKLLRLKDEQGWMVHSRVLGNVLYLMTSLTTDPETVRAVEAVVLKQLLASEP